MGAAAGVFSGIQAGDAYGQQADMARAQGNFNKSAYDLSASDSLSRGAANAGLATMKGSRIIGQQQAGYAASGVDTQVGSPLETMADTRMMSSLDAATIQNNAARESWGLKVKGLQAQQAGDLEYLRDKNAQGGAYLGAAGSGMSLITSLGSTLGPALSSAKK